MNVRAAAVLLVAWLAAAAAARAQDGSPLTDLERSAMDVSRASEAYVTLWLRRTRATMQADETLQRAALLARCERVARHDAPLLDSELRHGIELVARAQREELMRHDGPAMTRWVGAAQIRAFRNMTPAQREHLSALRASPGGQRATRLMGQLQVLESLASSVRPSTGLHEPALAIWLKDYLAAEQVLPDFMAALQKLDPEAATQFARVGSFEQHDVSDTDWLRRLAERLTDLAGRLSGAWAQRLDEADKPAFEALQAFHQTTAELALRGGAGAFGQPALAGTADSDGPRMPPGLEDELFRHGPDHYAREALARLCPRPAAAAR
jgi:hypothetical protein